MKTYLVYDRKSGTIVHVHREAGESRRMAEDLLRYVHPSITREHLAAVEIESGQMVAGKSYRINPRTNKLESAEAGANALAEAHQPKDISISPKR